MSWPELFIENWDSSLGVMKKFGIKGGHQLKSYADPSQIADDGRILVEHDGLISEYTTDGLVGVHLIWNSLRHNFEDLVEMMSVDSVVYEKLSYSQREKLRDNWVPGQRRMVALVCPAAGKAPDFWVAMSKLSRMSDDACDLHYMARLQTNVLPSQFGKMFGGIFQSVSMKPNGKTVTLPNGGSFQIERADDYPNAAMWLEVVGFDLDEVTMSGPLGVRNRRSLSIASALWASRNWNDALPRMDNPPENPEWSIKVAEFGAAPELMDALPVTKIGLRKKAGASPVASLGDMIACNSCTLFDQCRLARAGAICTLPESDMGELAAFFNTRDAQQVIDGLGRLLGKQADRVEAAIAEENIASDEDAAALRTDVTKMIHGLFDRGVKLAMLNDPRLKGGPSVQVSLTQNAVGQVTQGSPQQLAAGVVAELESRGVRREDITPELIASTLGIDEDVVEAEVIAADPVIGTLPEKQ